MFYYNKNCNFSLQIFENSNPDSMKKIYVYLLMFIFGLFALVSFNSCNSCNRQSDTELSELDVIESVPLNEQLMEDFNKSKLIFYSLPSPLETAMLIKRAGAGFDRSILNPIENISRYNTNLKMALNLGVYSADLSYASLFDQTQTTIEYMGNAKKLAEDLGIMGSIDEATVRKLEENMNNRDAVMDIISETFMNSNAYLSENNRASISLMVLAGGWIEGLYLATQLSRYNMENNQRLIDRIIYQKLSLYTLLNLMESYEQDPLISQLMDKFEQLRIIFDDIKIVNTSDVESTTDVERRVTTIKAQSETYMEPAVFEDLCEKVEELRTYFVS